MSKNLTLDQVIESLITAKQAGVPGESPVIICIETGNWPIDRGNISIQGAKPISEVDGEYRLDHRDEGWPKHVVIW